MRMKCKFFRAHWKTWDDLFDQATDFATKIGKERLVNISHAVAGTDGTVAVWYWE